MYSINKIDLWDELKIISDSIPEKEWIKIPNDLSQNLKHYLYGCEKELEQNDLGQILNINLNVKENVMGKKVTSATSGAVTMATSGTITHPTSGTYTMSNNSNPGIFQRVWNWFRGLFKK